MHATDSGPSSTLTRSAGTASLFFQALIENSRDAVAVADPEGHISYQSPAVTGQLGYPDGECLGRPVLDFVHPAERELVGRTLDALMAAAGSSASMELRLRARSGEWRWVEVRATNMLEEPAVGGVVLNTVVIDERKALELRNSAAKLDPHFLYNVLHSVAAMIREEQSEQAVEAIGRLRELTAAHVAAAGGELTTLAEEWTWISDYLALQRLRFGSDITIVMGTLPPQVEDTSVPSRLIQPLVENAVKHGLHKRSGAGSIHVEAELTDDFLLIRVAEEGDERCGTDGTEGLGVGVETTRQRLNLHFGDAATLTIRIAALSSESLLKLPRPDPQERSAE